MENWLSQPVFEGHAIRVIGTSDDPWWILSDICQALELEAPHRTLARLRDDEHSTTLVEDSKGRTQEMTVINESGVYRLIFMSRKPAAERFRLWVFREVLPSIRKTGRYELPAYPPEWVMRCLGINRRKLERVLEPLAQFGALEAQRYFRNMSNREVTLWPLSFCVEVGKRIHERTGKNDILIEAHMDQVCAQERMRPGSSACSLLSP